MTRTKVLQAFESIRVWQQGDKRAPHKPLLILLALGRLQQGKPAAMEFREIDAPLRSLIDEFGPSGAGKTRHYPFWHLATDMDGGIWKLEGPKTILSRPAGATPTLTELREHHIRGGFAPDILNALKHDPGLIQDVAWRILDSHFPETLHPDIIAAVGLDMAEQQKARSPETGYAPRSRDPGFRERVLRAYEYRCCVCGYDLRLGQQTIGLEAAHIKWFQAGGPDTESNGLALCALHHKIFDLGAFTVLPGDYLIAFSQHATGHDAVTQALLSKQGARILSPQSERYLPDANFLAWHREQVFKKPARAC